MAEDVDAAVRAAKDGELVILTGRPSGQLARLAGCWLIQTSVKDRRSFGISRSTPLGSSNDLGQSAAVLGQPPAIASCPLCSLPTVHSPVYTRLPWLPAAYDNGPWPRMTGYQRGRILERFADLVEASLVFAQS